MKAAEPAPQAKMASGWSPLRAMSWACATGMSAWHSTASQAAQRAGVGKRREKGFTPPLCPADVAATPSPQDQALLGRPM